MRLVVQPIPNSRLYRRPLGALLTSLLLVATFALPAHAIVRRRLNVNSNPQGALVYVDNQQIGTTPCWSTSPITAREVRLIKPGFETLTVNQPIPAPWYQYTPIDFVAENLVTTKIRDNRTVNYNLAPQLVVPSQELIGRANELRQNTLQYGVTPANATLPISAGPAPVIVPGPPVALPPVTAPEQLPPPPPAQPTLQQAPAGAPGNPPLLPPRL